MIARAPGKLALWGEYAVLAGAPAAVMAVDRKATVELLPTDAFWRVSASGFLSPAHFSSSARLVNSPAAALINATCQHLGHHEYPTPFSLHTDTRQFHSDRRKMGLGSSAAACVATYSAVCRLLSLQANMEDAMAIHRSFQGGKGSGMDVAASWMGGMIRFQDGAAAPASWPRELLWLPVWTGVSASTSAHLDQFARYRARQEQTSLDKLAQCSEALFTRTDLPAFAAYTDALKSLDRDGNLGIFSTTHRNLADAAEALDMVYKPCGAGGGDFGMAVGTASQVAAFSARIGDLNGQIIALETATHGVSVE